MGPSDLLVIAQQSNGWRRSITVCACDPLKPMTSSVSWRHDLTSEPLLSPMIRISVKFQENCLSRGPVSI